MTSLPANIPTLIGAGLFQLVALFVGVWWLGRGSKIYLRWLRIYALAFGICLSSLPFVVILVWNPPDDPKFRHGLLLAACFVPLLMAIGLAYFRAWQFHRQKKFLPLEP